MRLARDTPDLVDRGGHSERWSAAEQGAAVELVRTGS